MTRSGDRGETPFVSVVVPHYNDRERLRLCYLRLLDQTYPKERFEVVVADNNSECGLDAVKAALGGARVVSALTQGAGPARNEGVAASQGEVLAFLDSDCLPEPNWISEGVRALANYDFVGGQVITFARDPARPEPVEAFEQVFNFNFRRYIEKLGFTGTGNMFVPRTVFDRVGGFRAVVAEDMDWSFRARSLGFRIGYAPSAVVGHPARTSWMELKRRWSRMMVEEYELRREQRYGRALFMLKALAMPLSLLPHTAKILRSPRLPDAGARLGAIVVLTRLRFWRLREMLRIGSGSYNHRWSEA